jgi:hypothetical protein
MKLTRSFLVMAVLMAFAFQAEAKKVNLTYKLTAGEKFSFGWSVTQEIAQEMMGQSQTTNVSTSFVYAFKVLEVQANGSYRLEGRLTEYAMNTTTPMGEMKYNSATDKEVPDFAKALGLTLNEVYLFTLAPDGKITDVKAPDGLADKIVKAMGDSGDMTQQAMVEAQKNGAGTADSFLKSIGALFMNFPAEKVGPKSKWSNEAKVEQMVLFNTKTDYTLNKLAKDGNQVGMTAVITMADAGKGMEIQGMTINYELSGAKQGNFVLDPVSGLFTGGEDQTTISGVISVESPQLPAPMSIPMTIKSIEKLTRK